MLEPVTRQRVLEAILTSEFNLLTSDVDYGMWQSMPLSLRKFDEVYLTLEPRLTRRTATLRCCLVGCVRYSSTEVWRFSLSLCVCVCVCGRYGAGGRRRRTAGVLLPPVAHVSAAALPSRSGRVRAAHAREQG
jgi:hypothetical protein